MEIMIDCVPCMLRQALEAAKIVTDDIEIHNKVVEEAMKILMNYKSFRNSPDMALEIHGIIKSLTGNPDPYLKVKENDLEAAKKCYPYLKEFISSKDQKLYWALKIAATGNNIDAAVYKDINLINCIEAELEKSFSICDIEAFEDKLKNASNILIIGDNTGETVFDKVLIETLAENSVTYGVRNEPIINDATKKDAIESGLGKVARIVSTGCNAPGLILEDCSDEFIDIYNNSDIIISKGQGNYEALSEKKDNLFFLLKAKCLMVANKLNVNINDYVFKYNGRD